MPAPAAAQLRPVDSLQVLVIVDNVTDSLSTAPGDVVNENTTLMKAGLTEMSGEAKCCANHGFSLLLVAGAAGERHCMLFDAGPEAYTFARNVGLLGVAPADIEAMALSHGHWDHAGGMVEAVRWIFAANGARRIPVHLNEGMLVHRANTVAGGGYLPMKPVPRPAELAAAGAEVVMSGDARLMAGGCFYLSGDIPRVTAYEKGLPGQVRRTDDGAWVADPLIPDERYLAVNVRGKGVVVFSMCSHAGVVNVLTDARKTFDGTPLHAVIGGFHLSGATVEPIIGETIRDLLAFGLKRVIPAHCTGWRAFSSLAQKCDERTLTPSAVGRTFLF